MTLLIFSGQCHVMYNVMTTRYIALSAGTGNFMARSVIMMLIFIGINKLWRRYNHF